MIHILTQPPKGTEIVDRFVEGDGHDRIEVGFRVFELWRTRFSWEQLQDNPDLVPLAALSAETGAGDLWRLNEIVDSADMDYDRKVDLQTILVIMAGLRGFPKEILRSIIREEMVHEHPIFKEWEDQAHARGFSQGIERGFEKGERQATIRLIKRILESRGIELPGHLDVKLQGAQAAVLEQLADEVIFTTDAQAAIKLMTQRLA